MSRYGMTIPISGVPLDQHREVLREMVDLGYTDFWSAEAGGYDAFTPLALAAAWAPEARLGTAIVPAFTRGPALMAMSAASLAEAAPGRFVVGIGRFAEGRAKAALEGQDVAISTMLHPSPASPAANKGWAEKADAALEGLRASSRRT